MATRPKIWVDLESGTYGNADNIRFLDNPPDDIDEASDSDIIEWAIHNGYSLWTYAHEVSSSQKDPQENP